MFQVRMVYGGAGVALAMGLMLGGAMRPDLAADDRPAGPQIILGNAALRSTGPFDPRPDGVSFPGKVPDYVMGTDWKRAAAWHDEPAALAPPAPRIARDDEPPTAVFARADYGDESPPPPPPRRARYPSLGYDLPTHAPVGQAVDDADEEPDSAG